MNPQMHAQERLVNAPIAQSTSFLTPGQVRRVLQPAEWGLAMIEVVIGYEWLLSGLDKVLSAKYLSGLADTLQTSIEGNANSAWIIFIQQQVLPHASIWALLVEIGELLVALGCFIGALLWVSGRFPIARWTRWLNAGVLLALCSGVLMTANYYLMAGHGLPGLNPTDPFDEGMSLDGVLTAIGLGLLVIHMLTWRSGAWSGETSFRQQALHERKVEEQSL